MVKRATRTGVILRLPRTERGLVEHAHTPENAIATSILFAISIESELSMTQLASWQHLELLGLFVLNS